ncbi:hypothetical protein Taro_017187 [Colocasia esculenta]|uniref:Uncharacterized protein n=1 Tax=Colocasia esculenta TaxID=4460 RepID=A0A843UYM8_COLES|nr:hypothetical protein [Colocasia esculenta]
MAQIKHSLDIPIVMQHLFNVAINGKKILQHVLLHVYTQPFRNPGMYGRQFHVPPYEKNETLISKYTYCRELFHCVAEEGE